MKPQISVIIPAYNEESRISETLSRIDAYFESRSENIEIVVVDDGSRDATVSVVEDLLPIIASLRILKLGTNRGKGAAVRKGVFEARGDIILFSDADLSTPVEEWEEFEKAFKDGADVVIGSRTIPGARIERRQPLYRVILGKTFNRIIRVLSGLPYSDTQCGFKAFRNSAAKDIFSSSTIEGFAFDVELLVIARKRKFNIKEVPVRWINSPDSRVSILRHGLEIIGELIQIRSNHHQTKPRG